MTIALCYSIGVARGSATILTRIGGGADGKANSAIHNMRTYTACPRCTVLLPGKIKDR